MFYGFCFCNTVYIKKTLLTKDFVYFIYFYQPQNMLAIFFLVSEYAYNMLIVVMLIKKRCKLRIINSAITISLSNFRIFWTEKPLHNIILVTDTNWQFNFCTVTLEEQQIMERNEKQQISGKTINIFNIIYHIINGPNITTLAKLLLRTFLLRRLVFVNMKILIL